MSINFPDSPTSGQVYTFGTRSWKWNGRSWVGTSATTGYTGSASYYSISDTPPSSPNSGDRWFDSVNGIELVWTVDANSSQWVEIAASGFIGFTGSSGTASATGYTGSVGYAGSQGYWGSVGFTGSQAYTGSVGFTGSIGFVGSQGNLGYPGVRGFTGSQGYTGSKGDLGYSGSQGVAGTYAALGYTGSIGFTGSVGFVGSGYAGSRGDVGFTGSQGIQGFTGFTGSASTAPGYTGSAAISLSLTNKTSSYTLQSTDANTLISITTGGITVPSGVFNPGDSLSIYNNSGIGQTITQGTSVTMYLVGTATTGNRNLAQRGIATVICTASNTFVITGGGIT